MNFVDFDVELGLTSVFFCDACVMNDEMTELLICMFRWSDINGFIFEKILSVCL